MSDEELVERTRRGDRRAFGGWVERYEQPAILVASSVLHCWRDARVVVQDSFVIVCQRLKGLWSAHRFGALPPIRVNLISIKDQDKMLIVTTVIERGSIVWAEADQVIGWSEVN